MNNECRHISLIYCDDIRQEIGHKLSFMGTYTRSMIVQELPLVLSKFCVHITVQTPATKPFQKLIVRLLKDEEVIAELPLPESEINNQKLFSDEKVPKKDRILSFRNSFILSPFVIDEPCRLRVRAETESEEIKGVSLSIELAKSAEFQKD